VFGVINYFIYSEITICSIFILSTPVIRKAREGLKSMKYFCNIACQFLAVRLFKPRNKALVLLGNYWSVLTSERGDAVIT
jgi:hypothetical protein